MLRIDRIVCTLIITLALSATASIAKQKPAEHIWLGTIITMDQKQPVAEAIAVRKGEIIAIGDSSSVLALGGRSTEIIRLGRRALLPGFVMAHEHPGISAVFGGLVDMSGFTYPRMIDAFEALGGAVRDAAAGEWVYGIGLDPVLQADFSPPTLAELDSIAPDNPLFLITQAMHSYWANSKALEAAGITEDIQDPPGGGYYGRDEDGNLTGFIAEAAAAAPILKNLRKPLRAASRLKTVFHELSASGITTVASMGFNPPPWLAKWMAREHFRPIIRQVVYLKTDELSYLPSSPDNGTDFYRIGGVKLWHDGSPYTGTMDIHAPYLHNDVTVSMGIEEGASGEPLITDSLFFSQMLQFDSEGWQLAVHAQGDASNEAVCRMFQQLGARDRRHRLEHGLLMSLEVVQDLAALGMTASFHVDHISYYGDALAHSVLGLERASQMLPIRSAVQAGLRPSLHADSPMFPAKPFHLMQTAISRSTTSGMQLGSQEAVGMMAALRMVTIDAAWQLHMDHIVGSLEVGKRADLVEVSSDPLKTDVRNWNNIQIKTVWLDGRQLKP